jgi:tetratricopeptide (TPR) repeat protein
MCERSRIGVKIDADGVFEIMNYHNKLIIPMLQLKSATALFVLFALWAFIAPNPAYAQTNAKIDSLKAVLNRYSGEDTVKVKTLLALSKALLAVNPASNEGIDYGNQALKLSESLGAIGLKADALFLRADNFETRNKFPDAIGAAGQALTIYEQIKQAKKVILTLQLLGVIYYKMSDNETSKKHLERSLSLSEQIQDEKSKMKSLNSLAIIYGMQDTKKAIAYYEQAIRIVQKLNDKEGEARLFGNMGRIHNELGDYVKALDYLQTALRIHENTGDSRGMAFDYQSLAATYEHLGDNEKTLEYTNKALSLAIKTGNKQVEASSYARIGTYYHTKKRYDEAVLNIEKSIEIYKKIGNTTQASYSLMALGRVYTDMGKKVEAYRYFQESLNANKAKMGFQLGIVDALNAIATIYIEEPDSVLLKIGIDPGERFSKALTTATEALEISTKVGIKDRKAMCLKQLSAIYENKDYARAYEYYKQYVALKDSISGDEVKKQITRREIQYEFDKKETELKYQQRLTADELEKQRLLTVQQEQTLALNRQTLTLKEQALALSNKEKDLAHLAYLKEQAEKQEKAQELYLSKEREKGKERDLTMKNLELSTREKQNMYLVAFVVLLLSGLGALMYFYSVLQKQKNIIAQQNEINEHTISILSHDIKSPLLGVKLLLKKLNRDDLFVAQASQSLENQINAVNGVLNNLLRMKKVALSRDKNASANVNIVLQNVLQELSVMIQAKELTIQNDLIADVVLPIAPEKLQIILHNLLSNAIKYSFPEQAIRIFCEGEGIAIQDFGVGLLPEQRSGLMRQVTASREGTQRERGNGLGLFLVGVMLQGEAIKIVFDSPDVGGTVVRVLNG